MARPADEGLSYFPLDVDIDRNDKIYQILAECGEIGFGRLVRLLCEIYGGKGYYKVWDETAELIFAGKKNIPIDELRKLIQVCFRVKLFDKRMYNVYKIITSKEIQNRYISAKVKKRVIKIEKELLLVDLDDYSGYVRDKIKCIKTELIPYKPVNCGNNDLSNIPSNTEQVVDNLWISCGQPVDNFSGNGENEESNTEDTKKFWTENNAENHLLQQINENNKQTNEKEIQNISKSNENDANSKDKILNTKELIEVGILNAAHKFKEFEDPEFLLNFAMAEVRRKIESNPHISVRLENFQIQKLTERIIKNKIHIDFINYLCQHITHIPKKNRDKIYNMTQFFLKLFYDYKKYLKDFKKFQDQEKKEQEASKAELELLNSYIREHTEGEAKSREVDIEKFFNEQDNS